MKKNTRLIIFTLILLSIGVIFAVPYFNKPSDQKDSPQGFTITQEPGKKIDEALKKGRPVYIEFYGKT